VAQRKGAQREALAALQSAEAALKLAQLDLDYTEIKAPIAGRVGRLEVTPGNLVGSGDAAQPLTTLVSVDPIYASFDAGEELVATVLAELPVKDDGVRALENVPVEIATLADGAAVRGKLQLVDNEVNAASGTIRLRAVFDNSDGLLIPGQFVRVRLGQPKPQEHLLVSERAIGSDQDKKFVFVVDDANTVVYRQVDLKSPTTSNQPGWRRGAPATEFVSAVSPVVRDHRSRAGSVRALFCPGERVLR